MYPQGTPQGHITPWPECSAVQAVATLVGESPVGSDWDLENIQLRRLPLGCLKSHRLPVGGHSFSLIGVPV